MYPPLLLPTPQSHKSFLKPPQLPGGVHSSIAAISPHTGQIKHINQLCSSDRCPFTPWWREAIMIKCLAQGHKHHGHSRVRTHILTTQPSEH